MEHGSWENTFQQTMVPECPSVHFVHELVGDVESSLPQSHFDLIYSISALEEVSVGELRGILEAAFQLLAPGGYLFGTHDLCFGNIERAEAFVDILQDTGYSIERQKGIFDVRLSHVLLEHPAVVMLIYQQNHPEDTRSYVGHWGTMFFVAQKA